MKAVIQRVGRCHLFIDGKLHSSIQKGLLVLLGIANGDSPEAAEWLSRKINRMRVFEDEAGKMNLSVKEIKGEVMLVSQFTLLGNALKGNRPSYVKAARPEEAIPLYESMIELLSDDLGKPIATGVFGENMQIELINDGPVTIQIDTEERNETCF